MDSPNISREEIDSILRSKRKRPGVGLGKACYPCYRRKVKCDGGQPCQTCRNRGHEDICIPHESSRRVRGGTSAQNRASRPATGSRESPTERPSRSNVAASPRSGPYSLPQTSTPTPGHNQKEDSTRNLSQDTGEYIYSGDNSVVSILRARTQDQGAMAREAGSVLGLANTYSSYPFMDTTTPQERWTSLLSIVPERREVLRFFHCYRSSAYPFNPILVDISRFESDLCDYLNAYADGELQDPTRISERWATEQSIGHISLLLAVLAAGAHFSDIENLQRFDLCQDFARRSFQALRLANFLFRPSPDIIQALLIIGNTLQNNGQSDAAWALLGCTVRLGQTLGLHTESVWPAHVKSKAKELWFAIVWQDSLLSLCYDRPPVTSTTGWSLDDIFSRADLSYTDAMHYLCRLGLDITKDQSSRSDLSHSVALITSLDTLYRQSLPHLQSRDQCKSLHDHLEHLALKMHMSFSVSVLCRPALHVTQSPAFHQQYEFLRERGKNSLIDASKAFLDFQTLSIVPLRTWSMIHTVLSSTLLLCIWEVTRNDSECRDLQQRVIEVFSAAQPSRSDKASSSSDGSQWLSERHIRALVALRNAVRSASMAGRTSNQVTSDQQRPDGVRPDIGNATGASGVPFDFASNQSSGYEVPGDSLAQNTVNPEDLSPVTYLDSIMNVPLFDFSQGNEFF